MKNECTLYLLGLVVLILSSLVCSETFGISDYSQGGFLYSFLTFDILKNGSALVNCDMSGSTYHSINLSIPKTAVGYDYDGDIDSVRFLEITDSYDYLEIAPKLKEEAHISVDYFWPDCAVPFNNSYYLSCDALLPLYPSRTRVQTNTTVIFPPNSTLITRELDFPANRTVLDRLYISFIRQGYEDADCHDYLPFLAFVQPQFEDSMTSRIGENVTLRYPRALSEWADTFFLYSSLAYCKLSSVWETRHERQNLTVNLVPALCIEGASAFYDPREDAVYFPAYWTIGASYLLFRPLNVLFHELGHSFTSFRLPNFLSEGLAEYTAFLLFDMLAMEHNKETMVSRYFLEDPLEDDLFNSSKFFRWDSGSFTYAQAFYVAYDLINWTGLSSFRGFLSLLMSNGATFYKFQEQDRYDLLAYYLNAASGKDVTIFFEQYGFHVNPNRLSYLQFASFILSGVNILPLAILLYYATKWFGQEKVRRSLLLIAFVSTITALSVLLFISSLSVENLLSPRLFVIGLTILLFSFGGSIVSYKLDSTKGRKHV